MDFYGLTDTNDISASADTVSGTPKHIKSNFQSFVSKENGITEKHGDERDRIT